MSVREPSASLLEAFDAPLMLLDGAIVVGSNAAARALFGPEIEGRYILRLIPHAGAAPLLGAGGEGTIALNGIGADDRRWELVVSAAGGTYRLLRLTDHSARAAAEKMRTDFVANASHELRTPLAALIGIVETLQYALGPDDSEDRVRFLAIMAGETRRMQRLIDELMSLSRIEADRYVPPRETVALAPLMRSACSEIDQSGRVRVTMAVETDVLGDRAQLAQLVDNLVSNALRYGRADTPVEVRLERVEEGVRLSVADQGEGIPAEHLSRLTERFYRVAASRSRALGGTGLGLAIVKHIVERHRGRLDIASEVGVGTIVTVTLPVHAPPAPSAAES